MANEPERIPTPSGTAEFPCGNCGAEMTWDPVADALSCEYCGEVVQVPRKEGLILERSLGEAGNAARGFGVELRVTDCANCGARVTFDERSTAEVCVYCGSASVLPQEANRNALRPESLVPLDVGREQAREHFRTWLKKLWFRPNALKKSKAFQAVGVYVPFWTFDCAVHSDWSADAGYYYYVTQTYTVTVNGRTQMRTRQVQKVRWVPAWGERRDAYDDQLVLASKGLSGELMNKLGGFETGALVPYQPAYLAGWRAEEYSLDLEDGWRAAQEDVVEEQRRRCSGDVPGDTQRSLRVQNTISEVRWKHVLLPIWSLQYRFGGKAYTVLVNGQSGQVSGEAPLSWLKILLLVLGVGALAAILAFAAANG